MKSFLTLFFLLVFISTALGQMTNKLDKLEVNDLTAKKLDVVSTTSGSKPCPSMSQVQRDAIASPIEGQCIYNNSVKTLNLYDGSAWVEVAGGGEGGIANWLADTFYQVGDVVIYNLGIYQCKTEHTSTSTFDASKFDELANDLSGVSGVLSLDNGGTNKALTASNQGVVFSDADSLEILPKGAEQSVLKIEGGDLAFGDVGFEDLQGQLTDGQIQDPVSLSKGGTNKALVANDKGVVYSDADSLEILAPGDEGKFLKMGATAPEWADAGLKISNNYATETTASRLVVPNDQATELEAGRYYLETGNKNILKNPSFEAQDFSQWNVIGNFQQSNITFIDGGFSLQMMPVNQQPLASQDSFSYADQFSDNTQGIATARVKTSLSGIKLCARKNFVTQTNLCVTHSGSGKWELLKVPFILDETANGLVVYGTSNVTGSIYVDDTFVGAVDLSATQSFDTTCDTLECETTFSARVIGGTATIVSSDKTWFTIAKPSVGVNTITLSSGLFTVAPSCTLANLAGDSYLSTFNAITTSTITVYNTATNVPGARTDNGFTYFIICKRQGADYAAAIQAQKNYEKTKISSYSSLNADTDWQNATSPTIFGTTTNPTTGTIVNNSFKWKRTGGDLELRWQFNQSSAGTAGSGSYYIELPNGLQVDTSRITAVNSYAGNAVGYVSAAGPTSALTGTVQVSSTGSNRLSFVIGNDTVAFGSWGSTLLSLANTTLVFSAYAKIPISGWENSNIIIGQFNGLEKCENTLDCTDVLSAYVGASGIVSGEYVDFISGICSYPSTGRFDCTFNSSIFTVAPTIVTSITSGSGSCYNSQVISYSSTSFSVFTKDGAGTLQNCPFHVIVQKQGADYIGKTAKAVASDQSVRSIGSINVDIQSVYFGSGANCSTACTSSPCTVCSRVGTKITDVTRSGTGDYKLNGIDGTKYVCTTGNAYNVGVRPGVHSLGSSTSTYAQLYYYTTGTTLLDVGFASVTCIGIP
jgi:hypothetical protein